MPPDSIRTRLPECALFMSSWMSFFHGRRAAIYEHSSNHRYERDQHSAERQVSDELRTVRLVCSLPESSFQNPVRGDKNAVERGSDACPAALVTSPVAA